MMSPRRTLLRASVLAALWLGWHVEFPGPARGGAIDPSVARLYVGETVVVEGRVVDASRDGNVVKLRVGEAPEQVVVSLVEGLLSNFPPQAESFYAGKQVRVAGLLRSFRGATEMTLHDASGIQVIVPGQSDTTGAEQMRIRELERRVKELETTPPTPAAAPRAVLPSPAPTAVPSQPEGGEAAEDRLKKMEWRVRQLEKELRQKR